jgi:hypothetical protein
MPSFKPKPTKKIVINKKDAITLDEKHKEFMNHFSMDESVTIPKLRKYRKQLRKKLELLKSKINVKHGESNWKVGEKIEDTFEDDNETTIKHTHSGLFASTNDGGEGDYSEIMYKMLDDTDETECYDEEQDVDNDELQTQHMNNIVYKIKSQEQQNRCGVTIDKEYNVDEMNPVERIMEIQDAINEVTKTLRTLKNEKNKYMLDNITHIFNYFENKKQISSRAENIISNKTTNDKVSMFFKISNNQMNTVNMNIVEQNMESNHNIVNKYLTNVDPSYLNVESYVYSNDVCSQCNKGEMILMEDDGILLCNKCFHSVQFLIDNEKPSYKETPKEVCFYAYKKINHFKEILSQFQGKESTKMDKDVIEIIKQQIKKERIDLSTLTYSKTKEILKKLGYNKYYEHITFIKQKLGIQPLTMSPELEETLCNLFIDIQAPYAKCVPDYRVNFLNYYYVLYKLLELLGETKYLPHIPMLKDRDKLLEQSVIWKEMCAILDWEVIESSYSNV